MGKEDKRLNEVIRIQKRPNGFVMLDKGFIENENLSWKAKGILAYLLSKPDNWKVIIKDLVNHSTDGKAAVYSGLKELSEQGYYKKVPVRDSKGKRISHWEGTISEVPMESLENTPSSLLTDFQEIDNQDVENQDIDNRTRLNKDFNKKDFNDIKGRGKKGTPPPAQCYGEYNRVQLTAAEYDKLVNKYGETKALDYINQLDRYIASTGKKLKGHCATVERWIQRDENQPTTAPIQRQTPPRTRNRFANFEGRKRDYDELKRLERQYLLDSLK